MGSFFSQAVVCRFNFLMLFGSVNISMKILHLLVNIPSLNLQRPSCMLIYFSVFVLRSIVVVQSLSIVPTLCDPIDCRTPGFSVLHHLPEFAQTHIHWVDDTMQPSYHLFSLPPPSLNQGLFQWVSSSHKVPKVLELQLQHQSFQLILKVYFFRIDWSDLLVVQGTLKSLLHHHIWKTQFFSAQPSL